MGSRTGTLWITWVVMAGLLALVSAVPSILAAPADPYGSAGVSVLAFVLTLFAMTAGVGSLAVREALVRDVAGGMVDPEGAEGWTRVIRGFVGTWVLCVVVAGLGAILAWASARPALGAPYLLAATALLAFHTPRANAFRRRW